MESKTPSARASKGFSATRRSSVLALAAALLFTSLFVDVGVARAEYPAGWEDPDSGNMGGCVITCVAFFISPRTGGASKYGLAGPVPELRVGELQGDQRLDAGESTRRNCCTGVLGQPCGGREYTSF